MNRQLTIGFGLLVLTLGGCTDRDPYTRTDVWKPTGANAANLAVMVANPQDLVHGRSVTRSDTRASELAVDHVWSDQPKPFVGSSGSSSSGSGSGSGGSGGGGSGGGGSGGGGGTPGS
jgi:type IV pilus biogenesis protein CpaD/CtpE